MSTTAPSSYRVMNAANELETVRAQLIAICPDIEDDPTLFADMLEGEAGDALKVIERLIEASIANDGLADMVKARQADLAERKARFERRRDACRTVAQQVLERINLKRLERPAWTASVANRPPRVLITDESALDDTYIRIKREPDKAMIAAALKAGDSVPGATLSNGGVGLTVRTR
jgi:Siphovirus Gp157